MRHERVKAVGPHEPGHLVPVLRQPVDRREGPLEQPGLPRDEQHKDELHVHVLPVYGRRGGKYRDSGRIPRVEDAVGHGDERVDLRRRVL